MHHKRIMIRRIEDRFREAPKPAREARALPRSDACSFHARIATRRHCNILAGDCGILKLAHFQLTHSLPLI
jgi:hypothetical protein